MSSWTLRLSACGRIGLAGAMRTLVVSADDAELYSARLKKRRQACVRGHEKVPTGGHIEVPAPPTPPRLIPRGQDDGVKPHPKPEGCPL